jgi:hypothetical protein
MVSITGGQLTLFLSSKHSYWMKHGGVNRWNKRLWCSKNIPSGKGGGRGKLLSFPVQQNSTYLAFNTLGTGHLNC